jgi:urea transport system permease protein
MISLFARGCDRSIAVVILIVLGAAVALTVLSFALPPSSLFYVPSLWGKNASYIMLALLICSILSVAGFAILILIFAVAVPVINLALPPGSPLYVETYLVSLWGKYACYAMLALSIDLIWGYCGILSLGHGAFFALGGYAMGMYLMRQIGTRGVYADPVLPDFMVFLNWDHLPFYWEGFDNFAHAAVMVLLVPGLLAFVFGWLAFRSRVTGVYFSIITQALTFALMLAFFRNNFGFGGNNGLTDFKDILGFNVQAAGTRNALFAITCAVLAAALIMCRVIATAKFGKVLVAIRDAESRVRFLGYRPESYKLVVFTLSACMAGLAGALYVPQVGIINPSEFAPANSIEEVIWVAVGGRGTLTGAILGAVVVNYGKTYFTSGPLAPYWLFVLGGLFVSVTLLLPRGIVGSIQDGRLVHVLRLGLQFALQFGMRIYRLATGSLPEVEKT